MATKDKLREAILELLIGQASGVSDSDGTTVSTGKNNDKIAGHYDNIQSLPAHIISKETLTSYTLSGMQQSVSPSLDPATQMPIIDIVTTEQPNFTVPPATEEGAVQNVQLDTISAKKITPTDYQHDPLMQSFVNSIAVSIANSIAEAVTKIITAKIENNFTDFTIEFSPPANWTFSQLTSAGAVIPGGQGALTTHTGQIQFNGTYVHKCKVKFSNL